ncbi:MAG: DDE-type integrase/transposase/recombinase [Candidatus Thermoplasmatota archaeon]
MGETTMEWDGIEIVKKLLKEKHIVIRERTPIETQLYGVFLYLGGLSLKRVKTRLLGITRSRTAIRTWVQKFSGLIKEKIADELPEVVIADETPLQVKDMNLWFWYIIDPKTRKLIYFKITWNRTNHACKKLFSEIEAIYGKKPRLVITDGGPWYHILPRLGISHEIVSGGYAAISNGSSRQ